MLEDRIRKSVIIMKNTRLIIISMLILAALTFCACSKNTGEPGNEQVPVTEAVQTPKPDTNPVATPDTNPVVTPDIDPVATPEADPVVNPDNDSTPEPDSGSDITDAPDENLSGTEEEYFTSQSDIVGVWYSDYVDRMIRCDMEETFGFVYADSEGDETDGVWSFVDVNLICLSFFEESEYSENMYLTVADYDHMIYNDTETFTRIYPDDIDAEEEVINTEGAIIFTWAAEGDAPMLSCLVYDENGVLLDNEDPVTDDSGSQIVVCSIAPGVTPVRIEIMGADPLTANEVFNNLQLYIEMTHGTDDETDYYAVSLDALADCYMRADTGIWYYNVPVDWYNLYLAQAQAG